VLSTEKLICASEYIVATGDLTILCLFSMCYRKWYKSCDRDEFGWSIVMSGNEIKDQLANETEISYHTMAASCRDTNLRDRIMYANEEFPWGALTEPDWSVSWCCAKQFVPL
jgi:hypothetical protein